MKLFFYLLLGGFLLNCSVEAKADDCISIPKEIVKIKYNEEDDGHIW